MVYDANAADGWENKTMERLERAECTTDRLRQITSRQQKHGNPYNPDQSKDDDAADQQHEHEEEEQQQREEESKNENKETSRLGKNVMVRKMRVVWLQRMPVRVVE